MNISSIDWFGFLPNKIKMEFDNIRIIPIHNFEDIHKEVKESTNKDGYIYPPLVNEYIGKIKGTELSKKEPIIDWEKIPKSEMPAQLHRLPPSHMISFENSRAKDELRKYDSSFIIYLLSYLYGVRLQFYDWYFNKKIPVKSTHHIAFTDLKAIDFISHAYKVWGKWDILDKRFMNNILYMNSIVESYDWDWEKFVLDYMVFDSIYKLFIKNKQLKKVRVHKEQLSHICNYFQIPVATSVLEEISAIRNELLHEALWCNETPSGDISIHGYARRLALRQLNQRLVVCLFNYNTEYLKVTFPNTMACIF